MEYLCYVSMTPFFFLKPIVVSQKKKKKKEGGVAGPMLGLWDLRTGFL